MRCSASRQSGLQARWHEVESKGSGDFSFIPDKQAFFIWSLHSSSAWFSRQETAPMHYNMGGFCRQNQMRVLRQRLSLLQPEERDSNQTQNWRRMISQKKVSLPQVDQVNRTGVRPDSAPEQ